MLNIPKNKSVLVIANYRSGSTALCDIISKNYNLKNLDEFFHRLNNNYDQIINYSNFVIKVQPDQVIQPWFDYLINRCYCVGIHRKSFVDQVTSFYIAQKTHNWHQKHNIESKEFAVEIDIDEIENQIRYIFDMKREYNKLKQYLNEEVIYENICKSFKKSDYFSVIKPVNEKKIKEIILEYVQKENLPV